MIWSWNIIEFFKNKFERYLSSFFIFMRKNDFYRRIYYLGILLVKCEVE